MVVAADGLRSAVRSCCAGGLFASKVLLLGDARRGFRRERDLGIGRICRGGNEAVAEGVALARALRFGGEVEAFAFAANASVAERRAGRGEGPAGRRRWGCCRRERSARRAKRSARRH